MDWRVFAAVVGMAASGAAMGAARAQGAGALAQAAEASALPRCRARQVEIYQEGGDGATGHGEQIVGLRNVSAERCTLFGPPRLEFFDKEGKRLAIPYGKNTGDFMFERQPEKLVTLEPGGFAYFMIGTTVGDEQHRYHAMRVVLPGDDVALTVEEPRDSGLDGINVSAIVGGVNTDDGWAAPTKRIAATGGSMMGTATTGTGTTTGVLLMLDVPDRPQGPFDAHFTLLNTGTVPVRIGAKDFDAKECSLTGRLTNSAGKIVWEDEPCRAWSGEIGADGLLRPGARATADIDVGDVALQLCREGEWKGQFSLNVAGRRVNFAEFPFEVVSTGCSDSEHVGEYVDENTIRWSLIPQHGVRLGVAVRAKGDAAPATAPLNDARPGLNAAEFHAGEPIELRLFLDDLADAPLAWKSGADAFRVVVRIAGHGDMLPQPHAEVQGNDALATVAPHTWGYAQTVMLNELYDLAPGSYEVVVGPRSLMGDAAAANAPSTGWPYAEGSATVTTFVRIVP